MLGLILSLFFSATQPGDPSPWPFQHIGNKEGLSNSAINTIYMDNQQYVWFGTWDGLNRYDGTSLKTYKPDSFVKGTISNNVVRNIVEDKNGDLWIVTHKGINRYDRNADAFTSYFTNLEGLPSLEYNTRVCLGPDSLIWVNVGGKGVSRYNQQTDSFDEVVVAGLSPTWMEGVSGMGSFAGILYLLHRDGEIVSTINGRVLYRKQVGSDFATRLHYFTQIDGRVFFAAANATGGVTIFDLANLDAPLYETALNGLPVSSISADKANKSLWVGTETGEIFRIAFSNGTTVTHDMTGFFPAFPKSKRKILSIVETDQDIVWVGTDGDGVFKFLTKPKPFHAVGVLGDRSILSSSIVRSVYEDKSGTIYIGTRSGGLNIITADDESSRVLNATNGLSNNTVLAIGEDRFGNKWLGTDGEGIDMLEHGTNRILHFPRDFVNSSDVAFGNVYDVCVDVYGTLWLGTSGYGVIQLKISKQANGQYRLDNFRQISYSTTESKGSINSNVVYTIVEEMPNILWFGTRGAGVYRYNTITHEIEEHFHTASPGRNRLSNDDVLSLYVGSSNSLWVGTSGGLNRIALEKRSYQISHYTHYEGLPNNTIHSIQEDGNGMIWLSTNNGLISFDPVRTTFKTFDANDGLQNNEFTDGASFRAPKDNKLYFGGINGLDMIRPDQIDTTLTFPRLCISQFQIHNMIVTPSDSSQILNQHIDVTSELELAYDQNFISFHFTTLDYWNKQRTEYAYFLKNFDKDWNYIGAQNVVNLTNIPPGEYTLLINYRKNGVWNPLAKKINIVVSPPFWQTPWAYLLYALVVIAVQVAIILYIRERARTKRAAAINNFKIHQMKELNDYKLQFFTNVAHEFRTPLTLILGPVSTLIQKTNSLWEKSQLRTIYNNSIRLQKLIEELLQFRKIESGKDNLKISETEILSFTQEIIDSFMQHAADHDVHLEFIPQVESINGWIDKRKIEKILINLISNAIKYNVKGGTVDVVLFEQDGKAIFRVRDSGVGIASELQPKIFDVFYNSPLQESNIRESSAGIGLSLTKSLVQLHGGSIELESRAGMGTEFTIEIPINRDAYATSALEDNLIAFHSANLAEKVSQEFSKSFNADGILPLIPTADKKLTNTILVVDDNEQIIILLKNILSDKYHVLTASNGNEALVSLHKERVDLVISDILMPGMDGLSLCRAIKDDIQTSHTPVILLTAKAEIEDRIEGLQVGADSYIPKPFHPEHLFTRIEKLIQNREQVRVKFSNLATGDLEDFSTGMGEKDDQFFIKITQCIQQHMSEPAFTADVIAEEVGLSKASLYKKVKAITNLTPHGLIKQYRLRRAAELLKTTTMSVSEVIYETGFNSRSYFYKSFNEMFNCHPKDFGSKTG